MTNRLEIGFSSRISRQSRESAAEPIKLPEPRGAALQTCHVAQPEDDACVGVSGRGTGYRIAREFQVVRLCQASPAEGKVQVDWAGRVGVGLG